LHNSELEESNENVTKEKMANMKLIMKTFFTGAIREKAQVSCYLVFHLFIYFFFEKKKMIHHDALYLFNFLNSENAAAAAFFFSKEILIFFCVCGLATREIRTVTMN
jgi:hypothetical protein